MSDADLLDVVPRAGIIGQGKNPSKAIQAVTHGDVNSLPENSVFTLAVRYDLSVPSTDVEHDGVIGPRDHPAHLDVGDAMVDGNDGLAPEQGEGADGGGGDLERRAHAGALGVAEAVDVGGRQAGIREGGAEEGQQVAEVVVGRLPGEEAVARRRDVGVAGVGEDVAVEGDDAHAYLVGRPLEPHGNQRLLPILHDRSLSSPVPENI